MKKNTLLFLTGSICSLLSVSAFAQTPASSAGGLVTPFPSATVSPSPGISPIPAPTPIPAPSPVVPVPGNNIPNGSITGPANVNPSPVAPVPTHPVTGANSAGVHTGK
ncbi:MAG: hypothetical protein ABI443_04645 [Chthoniobacterales bacterium]